MTNGIDAETQRSARQALLRRRATLTREIEAGTAKRGTERDGNVPDTGEIAADDLSRDVALAEVDRDAAELAAVDAAIERLDTGRYGRCIDCGTPIGPARLKRNPEAARCVTCQKREEEKAGVRIARL